VNFLNFFEGISHVRRRESYRKHN